MPKIPFTENHELADHQLDMQAGSNNPETVSKAVPDKEIRVGEMTPEELKNFLRQKKEEERRNGSWGRLFT
jgi:hypothetical protein